MQDSMDSNRFGILGIFSVKSMMVEQFTMATQENHRCQVPVEATPLHVSHCTLRPQK